jgi:hypothetical protein
MEVHVIVCIDVIENQPGSLKGLKLSPDFSLQLLPDAWAKKPLIPGAHEASGKHAPFIHKIWNDSRSEQWTPFH